MLRFRYTTYMGEHHPAEKKIVVEFCPEDLPLTEAQQLKLKKLAGARYNGATGIVKMSCEMFEEPAQNKRYLLDLVKKLVQAARVRSLAFILAFIDAVLLTYSSRTQPTCSRTFHSTTAIGR